MSKMNHTGVRVPSWKEAWYSELHGNICSDLSYYTSKLSVLRLRHLNKMCSEKQHMHYPGHLYCPYAEKIEAKVANVLGFYNVPLKCATLTHWGFRMERRRAGKLPPCLAILIIVNGL